MKNKIIAGLIIVAVIIAAGIYLRTQNAPSQTKGPAQRGSIVSSKNAVTIRNFAFSPSKITIKKGNSVTWTNQDSVGHSATADDNSFDTGILSYGESRSITFNKKGIYAYHCSIHPFMKAEVVVN